MHKRTKLSSSLMLAFGGALAIGSAPSLAQTTPVAPVTPQSLERVEVTGSRIRSLTAESPSPLQVLTSEDIQQSGATNIQELLLKNPTFGTPTISRTNSAFSTSSGGVATVDLRNLGTARTLVLVNGRRFVAGVPGESAVDLNTIPTDFIERVELLTGGSSSLYGSDAVAGVVNIILKRNFQGLLFDGALGQSSEGDDTKRRLGLTMGTTAADGKAQLMAYIGWSKEGAVFSRDRDFAAVDQASVGAFITGDPADFFTIRRPFFSSFAPQGRFFFGSYSAASSRTFDADGNLIPFSTNGPAGDGVGATGFNRSAFRTIAVPTERFLFAGTGEVAINDRHRVFFEANYAQSQVRAVIEPFPLDSIDIFPASGGRIPAEFMVNGVIRRNPVVPDALFNQLTDSNGDGLRDYSFSRRMAEFGNRGFTADRDTYRVATGFKGSITPTWDYDAYIIYGATKEAQTSGGQVNVLNFRNALESVVDSTDFDGDGNTTEPICRDANARAQGCVPVNVFGFNTVSPGAVGYIQAPGSLGTFTSQKIAGFTVSGEAWQLPAGPLGIAVGGEYRKEFSRSEFDALTQAGLNAGNALPRTEGQFDVKEAFLEARVPLLKDRPGAQQLSLIGAVRSGKYSTVGSTTSFNIGGEWAPTRDFKFRATRARSTRAPNINELFTPASQDFPTGLVDPCVGVTATSAGVTDDRCRAAPGVLANINDPSNPTPGIFNQNQADLQGISGFNRGNPNLNEEKGNSTTVGVVVAPRSIPWLRNFTFTADYYDIKIKDAIIGTPRQVILEQCYSADATFCQFITRRPAAVGVNSAGSLEFIDQTQVNSGELAAEGIDVTVGYSDRVGPGRLNARLAYSYVKDLYLIPLPGADKDQIAGEIGAPKHKAYLTLGYNWGPWGLVSQTRYIGSSALDDQFLLAFGVEPGSIKVKRKFYNDFQLSYQWGRVQYYAGIDNAFNTKPAPVISGLPGNDTGTETEAGTYDPIGRRYYVGVRVGL